MSADWGSEWTSGASDYGGSSASSSGGGGGYGQTGDPFGQMYGAVLGGTTSYLGAQQTNRYNRDNVTNAQWFEREMSGSAMQRRAKDLDAAGLNPILAVANQQGASSSSGHAQAPAASPIGNAINGAVAAASLRKAEAETRNLEADTSIKEVESQRVVSDTYLKNASAAQIKALTQRVATEIEHLKQEINESGYRVGQIRVDTDRIQAERDLATARTKLTRLESLHSALKLPHALAESSHSSSWWGKNISPYLSDVGSLVSTAAGAAGAVAAGRFATKGVAANAAKEGGKDTHPFVRRRGEVIDKDGVILRRGAR